MAIPKKETVQASRDKKRESGLVRVEVWVKEYDKVTVKNLERELNKCYESEKKIGE